MNNRYYLKESALQFIEHKILRDIYLRYINYHVPVILHEYKHDIDMLFTYLAYQDDEGFCIKEVIIPRKHTYEI